jgi:hypothetical protein
MLWRFCTRIPSFVCQFVDTGPHCNFQFSPCRESSHCAVMSVASDDERLPNKAHQQSKNEGSDERTE